MMIWTSCGEAPIHPALWYMAHVDQHCRTSRLVNGIRIHPGKDASWSPRS